MWRIGVAYCALENLGGRLLDSEKFGVWAARTNFTLIGFIFGAWLS